MQLKLDQFFYHSVKDNVLANKRYHRKHVIESLLYVWMVSRFANIIVMLQKSTYELWRYDWLANFVYKNSQMYDSMMVLMLIMFCLVALVAKRYLNFAPVDTWVWRINYELIVLNTDLYYKHFRPQAEVSVCIANREGQLAKRLRKHWAVRFLVPENILWICIKAYARWQSWLYFDHVNLETFSRQRLPILAHISLKTRIRLAQFIFVMEYVIICFHGLMAFCMIGFLIFYYEAIFAPYSWTYLLLITTPDMSIMMNQVVVMGQVAVEFNLIATVLTITYHQHIGSIIHKLRSLKSAHLARRLSFSVISFSRILQHCYREHGLVSYYIVYCNREAWSNGLYGFVAISIPINLYLVSRFFLDVMVTKFEMFLIAVLCVILNVVCGFVLLAFSKLSKQMHRPRKAIYTLVPAIPAKTLVSLKLKYDNFYHRLSHKRKYGMSIGPWTTLTYRSIFKLFLVYVAYFLFLINLRLEMRARNVQYK